MIGSAAKGFDELRRLGRCFGEQRGEARFLYASKSRKVGIVLWVPVRSRNPNQKTFMRNKFYGMPLAILAAFGCLLATNAASGVQYDASAAVQGGGHDHVIWIPGIGFVKNDFLPTKGVFSESAGTATLKGTALDMSGDGFAIDALFSGHVPNSIPDSTADAPVDSPKVEGDGSDKGNWRYYTATSGTLTGVGGLSGQYFTFDRKGPAFQVGNGASGKNSDFGASGWLNIYRTDSDFRRIDNDVLRGDFNLDLNRVPDSGSTALFLGAAFAAMAVLRRKKVSA